MLFRISYLLVFIINIYFLLVPQWRGSSFWQKYPDVESFSNEYLWLKLISNFILICITITSLNSRRIRQINNIIVEKRFPFVLLFFAFLSSLIVNHASAGIFALIAMPLNYMAFYLKPKVNIFNMNTLIIIILIIWIVAPVVDYYFFSNSYRQSLFYTSSSGGFDDNDFSGYAIHKNIYGYVCGILFVILMVSRVKTAVRITLSVIVVFCILFSGCRSALVAIVGTVIFRYYFNKSTKLFRKPSIIKSVVLILLLILLLIIAVIILQKFSIFDDPARLLIYDYFFNIITDNIFFGVGETVLYKDDPAHNFILQIIADYGMFVFIAFVYVIYCIYKQSTIAGRLFIIYFLIISLFQPTLSVSIPNNITVVLLLLPLFIKENTVQSIIKS